MGSTQGVPSLGWRVLVRDLDALLLDAGNTLVFIDMDRVAEIARANGVDADGVSLLACEGAAKRSYAKLLASGRDHSLGFEHYFVALFCEAGVDETRARALVAPLWEAHDASNLWRRVPHDLKDALARARSLGLRIGVVSNSEGKLERLFAEVGLEGEFEVVIDSHLEGVVKPNPEIFHRALRRMGIAADRAIYAGDVPNIDVTGAHAAGMRAALIDPYDFFPDHDRSPRYASVAELVDALARSW
jgi:HAD superfamily hydrolase (TIGR01662 family)